jgi:hypothetical protein
LAGTTAAGSIMQRWDMYLNPKATHDARRYRR